MEHGMEHQEHRGKLHMMGSESVDMVMDDGVTVTARAPGARHPECGASSIASEEIKFATTWGGARVGAGRPRKPASVVVCGSGPRWYCIEVAPRAEFLAAAEIEALGVVALVPQYLGQRRVRERVGGQVRVVERPALMLAFPRYVFAEFDVIGPEWRRIATRQGVKRIIGLDPERPAAVPAVQMAWVIAQFGEDGVQRRPQGPAAPIKPGATVRVLAGPLQGHVARVEKSSGRTVWIEWAGRSVSMAQAAVVLS